MSTMVLLCWSKMEAAGFIRLLKFLQLAGANMLAITNLAICVNLALVVSVGCVCFVLYHDYFAALAGLQSPKSAVAAQLEHPN